MSFTQRLKTRFILPQITNERFLSTYVYAQQIHVLLMDLNFFEVIQEKLEFINARLYIV